MATYTASKTSAQFHADDSFVRLMFGPIGSGKSVACCMEIMAKAHAQTPNKQGVRRSRWAIIRNTYRELVDTTMKTWFDWFDEDWGLLIKQDMIWRMKGDLADGTKIDLEVMFRALDKPNDVKKLLSLELTGAFINESREIPKQILDMLMGRVGRFPSKREGGASWYGIILDTNPPDSDHWMFKLFEENLPHNHKKFHQPSGTADDAENIENLPDGYYHNMQAGKDREWINVYVHGQYGFVQDGKPVWPEYQDDSHHTEAIIVPDVTQTIYVGIDFGLTPAATFGFKTAAGRWIIFDELVTEDMGAKNFSKLLNQKINHTYPTHDFEIYGDPAGDQRAQTDEITPFQILASEGIVAWPTYTNDFIIRRESVAAPLSRMDFAGNPGFVITPGAVMCRKALAGGYKYKRMAVSGQERFQDKPDKGRYSHVADSLQYLMVGAGEGGNVISNGEWGQNIDYSLTDRLVL
jgi:hypothetical protein